MARRKPTLSFPDLVHAYPNKLHAPLGIVLGSPRETAELVRSLDVTDVVCYQMDMYQAERLAEELGAESPARVVTAADLWDLPGPFQALLYPVPQGGERALKIDMIEQAFHVLAPGGHLLVLSPYEKEQFFPLALKKVFKRVHAPAAGQGALLWCQRQGDRPRRRHEVIFQVKGEFGRSLRFLSRPGTFSYGRFDDGARALVETMEVQPGERVIDIGCGCGTNGIFAGLRSGAQGFTAFADSNLRAIALTEVNARSQELTDFQASASSAVTGWTEQTFDVALANPPYYAQQSIAQLFIERAHALLRDGGRLYLVTRQPDQVGPLLADLFGPTEIAERRGYIVLSATKGG